MLASLYICPQGLGGLAGWGLGGWCSRQMHLASEEPPSPGRAGALTGRKRGLCRLERGGSSPLWHLGPRWSPRGLGGGECTASQLESAAPEPPVGGLHSALGALKAEPEPQGPGQTLRGKDWSQGGRQAGTGSRVSRPGRHGPEARLCALRRVGGLACLGTECVSHEVCCSCHPEADSGAWSALTLWRGCHPCVGRAPPLQRQAPSPFSSPSVPHPALRARQPRGYCLSLGICLC